MRRPSIVVTAAIVAALAFGIAACSESTPSEVRARAVQWPVVYGMDGRVELHEVSEPALRELGRKRVVAIMQPASLVIAGDEVSIEAPTLSEAYGLCAGERFEAQPAAAVCSGVLVDARTVLTAGHCLRGMFCDEMQLVFGYVNRPNDELGAIARDDVYTCKAVLASERTQATEGERLDYAWIELDRPVPGIDHTLDLRDDSERLEQGEPVTLLGFSGGTPLKVDASGSVVDPRDATKDYFVSTADSFDGDSGAPILDEQRRIVGIQGRGGTDYWPSDDGCNAVFSEREDGSTASVQATYASRAFDGLCKVLPEHPLCCRGGEPCAQTAAGCSIGARRGGGHSAGGLGRLAVLIGACAGWLGRVRWGKRICRTRSSGTT